MLIRRPEDVPGQPMQMEGVKNVTMRMMVGRGDQAPNFAMRHFTVEPGGHTPHHSHNYEHEVYVTDGEGQVLDNDTWHPIRSGDVLFVPPNVTHQFRATGSTPLKFLCLVPVTFDCGKITPGSG